VSGGMDVKTDPRTQDLGRRVPQVTMPRAPRMQIPGGTNLIDLFYLATSPISGGPTYQGQQAPPAGTA
jgi:hypothetical protein